MAFLMAFRTALLLLLFFAALLLSLTFPFFLLLFLGCLALRNQTYPTARSRTSPTTHPITMPTVAPEDVPLGGACSSCTVEMAGIVVGGSGGDVEEGKESPRSTMVAYVVRGREIVRVLNVVEEGETSFILGNSWWDIVGSLASKLA
jgi:hypothetical protein